MKTKHLFFLLVVIVGCQFTVTSSGSLAMETTKDKMDIQVKDILAIVEEYDTEIKSELVLQYPEYEKEILEGSSTKVKNISRSSENKATLFISYMIIGKDMEKSKEIIELYEEKITQVLNQKGYSFK